MSTPKLIEVANIFYVEEGLTDGNLSNRKLVRRSITRFWVIFHQNVVHAGIDITASNLFGVIKHPQDMLGYNAVKLLNVF